MTLELLSKKNIAILGLSKSGISTIKFLKKKGIGTAIHYPIPIHMQPAAKYLGYKRGSFPETEKQSKSILTLPIHQNLKESNLKKIVYYLNKF